MPSRTLTIWLLAFLLGLFLSPFIARETGPTQGRLIEAPASYIQTKLFEDYDFISSLSANSGGKERRKHQPPLYPLHLHPQAAQQSHQARQQQPSSRADPAYATALTEKHANMGSAVTILPDSIVRITLSEGKLWKNGQRTLHEFVISEMEGPGLGNGTAGMVEYTRTWQGPALVLILREKGYLTGWVGREGEEGSGGMIDGEAFDRVTAAVEQAWEGEVASLGDGL
ncbi:hypothetical protein KC343_g10704 [Hortaea werneckii]|nr:hypothetical protein KC352_g21680 [Hortaea werneckii]KAI7344782.1 hypothetical protein KC320_g8658 [Hortaea werneckii]KAI7558088.1 hypothetical protein KC317_g11225 [Hortaea werneckii]KAI7613884.1 hypothetical protein KC343_g10704 [Hortaea werneckii]KAI7678871.1 hypothetical protein KC319_g3074 [Hortaea werneckii]